MDFIEALLTWYDRNRRELPWRGVGDPYAVLVSEIMLQQTRAGAVIPYYRRFMAELPTVQALAACPEERLLKLWQGLGYYTRARNLQACARQVVQEYGGVFPQEAAALGRLPGVGPYTAGAVASLAFGQPAPAVDGNVMRILARLFEDGADVTKAATRAKWTDFLQGKMGPRPGDVNQAFMDLGSLLCLPKNPRCAQCPLTNACRCRQNESWAAFPYRGEKKPKRQEQLTVFAIRSGGRFLVRRRPDKGLLAGLYELPHRPGHLSPQEITQALTAWGVFPVGDISLRYEKHIFTHVLWDMEVVSVETEEKPVAGYGWSTGEEPLPEAFLKCLR